MDLISLRSTAGLWKKFEKEIRRKHDSWLKSTLQTPWIEVLDSSSPLHKLASLSRVKILACLPRLRFNRRLSGRALVETKKSQWLRPIKEKNHDAQSVLSVSCVYGSYFRAALGVEC